MATTMTMEERQQFLAGLHVGVLSVAQDGRAPLTVPIWYDYAPSGDVWFITGTDTRKALAIRSTGRFSLCAQDEAPPYRYVTVEGEVSAIEAVDVERDLRPLARRYLGLEGGDQYVAENGGNMAGQDSVVVRMRPLYWLSADYSKVT